MEYQEVLIKINAMIDNAAKSFGKHSDEVFSDLADLPYLN